MQRGQLPAEYSYYTLMFGVDSPPNGKGTASTATITWSVNGNPIIRQITVGSGVEISGPADAVSVRVVDATLASINDPGQQYGVTIALVPGTRASNFQPLLTNVPSFIVFGRFPSSTTIKIPPNVGVIGAWVSAIDDATPPADPNFIVIEQAATGSTLFQFGVDRNQPFFVPIVPGSTQLFVENMDASNKASFSIVWVIDG